MKEQIQRLEHLTASIASALTNPLNHEDAEQVSFRITEYSSLLGTSAETVALSEMVYNEALGALSESFIDSKVSATDKKMIFAGRLKKEIYLLTLSERQNRALTHAIDGLRSVLSFKKLEIQTASYQ